MKLDLKENLFERSRTLIIQSSFYFYHWCCLPNTQQESSHFSKWSDLYSSGPLYGNGKCIFWSVPSNGWSAEMLFWLFSCQATATDSTKTLNTLHTLLITPLYISRIFFSFEVINFFFRLCHKISKHGNMIHLWKVLMLC